MAYSVPDLPYDYNALEPHIDEATMKVHHDKHHQAYVDKANAALEGTEWADKDVEEVLKNLSSLPDDKQTPVRNNGGGHYNHSLFWQMMSPDGGGEPDGDLAAAIDEAFGGFDDFKAEFKDAGVNRSAPAGRGWSTTAPAWRWSRPRTRTRRSPTARRRCSAATSGSTPTTSSTRTSAPTTSTPGGTSSTGTSSAQRLSRRWRSASNRERLGFLALSDARAEEQEERSSGVGRDRRDRARHRSCVSGPRRRSPPRRPAAPSPKPASRLDPGAGGDPPESRRRLPHNVIAVWQWSRWRRRCSAPTTIGSGQVAGERHPVPGSRGVTPSSARFILGWRPTWR